MRICFNPKIVAKVSHNVNAASCNSKITGKYLGII